MGPGFRGDERRLSLTYQKRPQLLLHLRLRWLRRAQNGAGLKEIQHAEDADIRPNDEIGRAALELFGHDGVAHDRDGGEQAFPRIGHALTFRVRVWQCVALVDAGAPVRVEATLDLATLEVLHGEGGLKPLTEGDKRRVLSNARKTIGPNLSV